MCEPVALLGIASLAFQVRTQQRQARFQKGVQEYNARVAENKAEETRRAGVEEENIKRRQTAELLSKQRAQLGAAGVDVESGSAFELQQDVATLGEADALRIRSNVESKVGALKTSSVLTRQQGEFAETAGGAAVAGTILGGTADILDTGVADKWFKPNSAANQTLEV
jgi:chromosome condensin MukBEF ATPase and DNA-binding subunit MukB